MSAVTKKSINFSDIIKENVELFKNYIFDEIKEEVIILENTFKDIKREKFNYLDYVLSQQKSNKKNEEILYGAYRSNLKKKLMIINNGREEKDRIPEVRINSLVQNLKPRDDTNFSKLSLLSNELSEMVYSWVNGTQGLGEDYSSLYNEAKGLNHRFQSIGEMVNEVIVTTGIVGGFEFLGLSNNPAGEFYQGLSVVHTVGRVGLFMATGKNYRSLRQYISLNPFIFAKSWHQLIEEAKNTETYKKIRSKFSNEKEHKIIESKSQNFSEPEFVRQYVKENYDS